MQVIALKSGIDFQWQEREETDEMKDEESKIFRAAQRKMMEGNFY